MVSVLSSSAVGGDTSALLPDLSQTLTGQEGFWHLEISVSAVLACHQLDCPSPAYLLSFAIGFLLICLVISWNIINEKDEGDLA